MTEPVAPLGKRIKRLYFLAKAACQERSLDGLTQRVGASGTTKEEDERARYEGVPERVARAAVRDLRPGHRYLHRPAGGATGLPAARASAMHLRACAPI
jgi:hypothetical protein